MYAKDERREREPIFRLRPMDRADKGAAVLGGIAFVLSGLAAITSDSGMAVPWGFTLVAPIAGLGIVVALFAMFAERVRHGIGRGILAACAVVLALAGFVFTRSVEPGRVLLCYWMPAVLAIGAALVLVRGHHAEVAPERRPVHRAHHPGRIHRRTPRDLT